MQGIREHWIIENSNHYVRDVTLQEDACRVQLLISGRILSLIRSHVLNILRRLGYSNIAEGIRTFGFGPKDQALRTLGI